MKNPKALIEGTFEPIRRKREHGAHVAKVKRGFLPRCNGKNSYRKDKAFAVREKQRAVTPNLYLYRCRFCTYWHLTHLKEGPHRVI